MGLFCGHFLAREQSDLAVLYAAHIFFSLLTLSVKVQAVMQPGVGNTSISLHSRVDAVVFT